MKIVAWWKYPNLLMSSEQMAQAGIAPKCMKRFPEYSDQLRLWIEGEICSH